MKHEDWQGIDGSETAPIVKAIFLTLATTVKSRDDEDMALAYAAVDLVRTQIGIELAERGIKLEMMDKN